MGTNTKLCRICNINKPLFAFSRRGKNSQIYRNECKPCNYLKRKTQPRFGKWTAENKEKRREWQRNYDLMRKFNITTEQFNKMLIMQNGECAICHTQEFMNNGEVAAVDHCYQTGNIRGLLCSNCNAGLGMFSDSPSKLLSAIEYLNAHYAKDNEYVPLIAEPKSGQTYAKTK
jgi:hypothetical protein